jgi:hypothetical protein
VGQELGKLNKQTQAEVGQLEGRLKDLTSSREWEIAQGAIDAAGIVDPTPISDGISAVMSLASGDFIGAGLSAVSMIPYLGDAVGKTAKGARALKKLKALTDGIADTIKKLDALKSSRKALDNRKEAARRAREARKAKTACAGCKPHDEFGVDGLPQNKPPKQEWKDGTPGNGTLVRQTKDGELKVPYKDGYPDYSRATLNGQPVVKGSVEIPGMNGSQGPEGADFKAAQRAMREQTGNPHWPGTSASDPLAQRSVPPGHTWHHKEDGVTMELIPQSAHTGVSHTGGASLVNDPVF